MSNRTLVAKLEIRRSHFAWLALVTVAFLGSTGCRGPLNPFSRVQAEPSFDRLIELENSSAGSTISSNHYQVAQRRPGSSSASSRHVEMALSDRAPGPPEAESNPERDALNSNAAIAQRSISDDLEDEPVEIPSKQRDLLEQTEVALTNFSTSGSTRSISPRPPEQIARSSKKPSEPTTNNAASNLKKSDIFTAEPDQENDPDESIAMRLTDRDSMTSEPLPKQADEVIIEYGSPVVGNSTPSSPFAKSTSPVVSAAFNRYAGVSTVPQVIEFPEANVQTASATLPASTNSDVSWDKHLRLAMQKLEKITSDSDDTILTPQQRVQYEVIQRLLALSLGDREQMSLVIDGLQPIEQDYFRYQFTALMDAIDPEANPVSSRRWSLVMLNQRKAHDYLASLSNLEINNLTFCTEVESFGVLEKFSNYQFSPDQEVLLYCELDNFVCEKSVDGKSFETQLQGNYEIIDANGKRIADQQLPADTHICRNRRRDYFIAYRIYMPTNISSGSYKLKLTIEDVKGHKFGQSELQFQIQ